MTAATSEVSTYLGQPVELFRFVNGVDIYNYTSADQPYTFQGVTYTPVPLLRAAITVNQEDGTGSVDITIARNDPLANIFIAFLPTVIVTIYRTHRNAPDTIGVFYGTVGAVDWKNAELKITCQPTTEALRRTIPAVLYQIQCNHVLYSRSYKYGRPGSTAMEQTGCNVNQTQYAFGAAVTAINGQNLTCPAAAEKPDFYFNNGWVARSTGEIRWIANHQGGALALMQPFQNLAVGETLTLYPGCDHTTGPNGCGKFNNVINFNGFEAWPQKNPFATAINH